MRAARWIVAFGLLGSVAQAQYRTIEERAVGQWRYTASRDERDGSASCSVATFWANSGRELRLTALEQPNSLNLAVQDPSWRMNPGTSGEGWINIDGDRFTATWRAISPTLAVTTLATGSPAAQRFIARFQGGYNMNMGLPWGQRIQAGLIGTRLATETMFTCVRNLFGMARVVPPPIAPQPVQPVAPPPFQQPPFQPPPFQPPAFQPPVVQPVVPPGGGELVKPLGPTGGPAPDAAVPGEKPF